MRKITGLICFAAFAVSTSAAFAAPPPPPPNEPNCQAVYNACTQGGYIYGDAGKGNGLYKDCIGPLVTGTQPPKAPPAGVTFPSQVAQQAQVCHQHHPKWGTK